MQVTIRPENEGDYKAVFEVNKKAFGQENEANLVELLRKGKKAVPELSLVAIHKEKKVVGHILFSEIQIVDYLGVEHDSLALAPVAVIPELQKKGIGGQLIQMGINYARILGYKSIIVIGKGCNYPKFGFEKASNWNIRCPFDVPDEFFMAIELVPHGLTNVSGMVRFPKEFDGV